MGSSITRVPVHQRNIGMLFQNYALFPHLTVAQNVYFRPGDARHQAPRGERCGCRKRWTLCSLGGIRTSCRRNYPAASSSGSRWLGRW